MPVVEPSPVAPAKGRRSRRAILVVAGLVGVVATALAVATTFFDSAGDSRPTRGVVAYADYFRSFRVVDLPSGRSAAIELPADGYPEQPVVTDGSIVFLAAGAAWVTDPPGSEPRLLGPAAHVIAAETTGTVWLVRSGEMVVQLVDLSGDTVAPAVILPEVRRLVASLSDGLLLVQRTDGTLEVLDPATGGITFDGSEPADVAATQGSLVAWIAPCVKAGCPLHLTDVATGIDRVIAPPTGAPGWVRGGAISPDGKTLAAFVDAESPEADKQSVATLVLVDVETGRLTPVPGSEVPFGEPIVAAAWSPTSGWLFYSGVLDPMYAYRPGPAGAGGAGHPLRPTASP